MSKLTFSESDLRFAANPTKLWEWSAPDDVAMRYYALGLNRAAILCRDNTYVKGEVMAERFEHEALIVIDIANEKRDRSTLTSTPPP